MTAHVSRSFPLALQGVHEDLRAAFKVVLPIVSELQPGPSVPLSSSLYHTYLSVCFLTWGYIVWKEANGADVVSRLVVAANLRALVGHAGSKSLRCLMFLGLTSDITGTVRDGDVVRRSLRLVKESFQASVIGRLVPYPLRL